ncbi:MAG: VWA domain-containing protein [Oscillochloris sp.]|nr:VWA domain-containing protein [Oscillochloris sp.]
MTEVDVRIQILNTFLTTPHGKLDTLAPLHSDAISRDPLFYGHLAVWYSNRGEVRDHKVLFAAHLLTSDFVEHRAAGWVLIQKLPPHMLAAALDHTKRVIGKTPRSFKSAVANYLRGLEMQPARFERAVMRSKQDLKHLYASLRIAPGAYAQQVLFDERPPEGSPLLALKHLAQAADPAEQARLIVAQRIPYTTAVGAVKALTPSVLAALIDVMTPQEVINHLKALRKRGAFDNPELKALIDAKLKAAEGDSRVSTLKATQAMRHVELDAETTAVLTEATDRRVASMARIDRPTALFVDKSSSMTQAIEVAQEVAALVSAICADFQVLAFDSESFAVKANGATRSAWEQAFRMVKANGATSIGAPLAKLARERHYVEQVIVITDMGENTAPRFSDAYAEYVRRVGVRPNVTLVAVGGRDQSFLNSLHAQGVPLTLWEFKGDYYSLPNLLPLLALPSRAELVEQVMGVPLPKRAA